MAATIKEGQGRSGVPDEEARAGQTALESRFTKAQEHLNPSRRKLVRLMLEQPENAYFLSSREMARHYGVDTATIVRTTQALGYRRFAEFASDLRSHFVARITPYTVLKAAAGVRRGIPERVRQTLDSDLRNVQALRSTLDPEVVAALSKEVKRARRILVIGIDLAASLSWYLAYGLMTLGFAAEAPVGSSGNVQRRVRTLTRHDLLIAISFGPCLRDTVEAAQRAKRLGVPTFGITDNETSPIARVCDRSCIASVASPSFGGSYVAPMALLGAILEICAQTRAAKSLRLLRRSQEEDRMDHRWFDVFEGLRTNGE